MDLSLSLSLLLHQPRAGLFSLKETNKTMRRASTFSTRQLSAREKQIGTCTRLVTSGDLHRARESPASQTSRLPAPASALCNTSHAPATAARGTNDLTRALAPPRRRVWPTPRGALVCFSLFLSRCAQAIRVSLSSDRRTM